MKKSKIDPDVAAFEKLLAPPPEGNGLTKTHIASLVNVTKQAITRWDRVPLRYVRILHEKTGIPKADLLPSEFA